MLQRDPKGRASLEEIESHAWLQGVDPSPATKFNTPLVSHKSLSEEEHNGIIQRMVLGDIADRETIVEQSWPTKIDMHQDIEDSLAASSISHAGGPQKSAPVLNQIFEEEGESDDDFDMDEGLPPKLSRLKMNVAAAAAAGSPGTTQKRYHRRKSQGRGSSCSSSETSDDDSESHRRLRARLETQGGNGGGSSGGQSKPPGEGGSSGPDRGSPPGGGGGGSSDSGGSGGGSSGGGGGGGKGQGSPSSCSNGSSKHSSSGSGSMRRHCASRSPGAAELMESLKLMSLCLSSQLQQRGRSGGPGLAGGVGKFIIDPQNLSNSLSSSLSAGSVKTQETSSWKMCIGSNGSLDLELDTIALPTTAVNTPRAYADQTAAAALSELALATKEKNKLNNLKNNVLQLPLCEKTISVNIQRSPREGLLCTSSQASCCQ
ncbi:unnamed protein product, partial [Coregonus sp. 'balchen']